MHALRTVIAALRATGTPLGAIIRRWVADAVRRGALVRGEDGLVDVREWAPSRQPPPSARLGRLSELEERARKDHEMEERSDLEFLLKHAYVQDWALHALGVETVEVPAMDMFAAHDWAPDLALISTGRAPGDVLKRMRDVLDSHQQRPPWAIALASLFAVGLHLKAKTPKDRVLAVLDHLDVMVGPAAPGPFRVRKSDHIAQAATLLRALRVNTLRPEIQPRAGKSGPALTPWGAARQFAEKFGVTLQEERVERRRKRKSR